MFSKKNVGPLASMNQTLEEPSSSSMIFQRLSQKKNQMENEFFMTTT